MEDARDSKIRTPVIFLTAKAEISDRVFCLDPGADNYLVKPFYEIQPYKPYTEKYSCEVFPSKISSCPSSTAKIL